jgi:hypothetical protein
MLGIITALGALFLELLVFTSFNFKLGSPYLYSNSLNLTIIFSVFLEEIVKIIVLFQILKKIIQEGFERKHIFLSAIMVGLGFATMEILFNLFNSQINQYLSWPDVLGLLIVHTGTFAILGYVLAKKTDLNFSKFVLLLPIVFSLHLLYNFIVIYQQNSGFYFIFTILSLIMILVFFWNLKRRPREEDLPKSEISL